MHSLKSMLQDFCNQYIAKTKNPIAINFGMLINQSWFEVTIHENKSYQIEEKQPTKPTFYLIASKETMEKIYNQEMHYLTAAGRASMSDPAPLDIRFMPGYQMDPNLDLFDFAFHFFVIGKPEMVPYGKQFARIVHGGYAIPFIYKKGLRTAWYRVEGDMIINEKKDDQVNPFDTLVIAIYGEGIIELDDVEYTFKKGMTYAVPKGMFHRFWSTSDEGLEFIIIMYGAGA